MSIFSAQYYLYQLKIIFVCMMSGKGTDSNCSRSDRIPEGFAAGGDRTMKWGRDHDYHGSRTYEASEPPIGRFSLMLHWIANVVRRRARKIAGRSSPPAFELFHFSLLGDDNRGGPRSATLPSRPPAANLPGRPAANLNARDWRVLP
jgi:hypothetical protein